MHAARVLRDVAADGADRLARRIGRIEEAVRRGGFRDLQVAHARLDGRRARPADPHRGSGCIFESTSSTPSRCGIAPPEMPVPAPRETTGTPEAAARLHDRAHLRPRTPAARRASAFRDAMMKASVSKGFRPSSSAMTVDAPGGSRAAFSARLRTFPSATTAIQNLGRLGMRQLPALHAHRAVLRAAMQRRHRLAGIEQPVGVEGRLHRVELRELGASRTACTSG